MSNPRLVERIRDARSRLASAGILRKSAIDRNPVPLAAHEPRNYDWRYLCAASFI
jgi:hypothetical protein